MATWQLGNLSARKDKIAELPNRPIA